MAQATKRCPTAEFVKPNGIKVANATTQGRLQSYTCEGCGREFPRLNQRKDGAVWVPAHAPAVEADSDKEEAKASK